MKLAYKINLLFTAIVSGILLVMSILIFALSKRNVENEFRQRLKTRAARTAYLYTVFRNDTTNLLKSLDATAPPALVNKNINIYNEAGEMLYEYHDDSTTRINVPDNWFEKIKEEESLFYTHGPKNVCIYFYPAPGENFIVVVAAENISGRQYIADLRRIFILFLPGAVLFTLLSGYLFSGSIIKPVKETIRDVQLITSQNLSHRLYVGNRKDELAMLNSTFNDLLNRLEESFAIQRRFISNASHELSTPLTSISSQIEVALLQNRDEEQYRKVLRSVLEDVQELHHLTRNLLEIAKAGTHGAISLDKVRIDEVLIRAHSEVLRQDPAYRVELNFPELPEEENDCMVFGNYHLLHSAFKNIMENGCKYSPDNTVKVQLYFRNHEASLVFINKSDFIPSDEISNLFEPFYRSTNAGGKPGVGLGLTLTRRIIGLHKGTLAVFSDTEQGTRFTILLPTLRK
jgi:signal transduction histidine kinase